MMEEGEGLGVGARMTGLEEEVAVERRGHLACLRVGGRAIHCEGSHESWLPPPLGRSCCWDCNVGSHLAPLHPPPPVAWGHNHWKGVADILH